MITAVMFVIFLLIGVSIVGICAYCYSGKEEYQEGMILGVHVPEEAAADEEVRTLTRSHKKKLKRFQLLNLAAAVLIPGGFFINMAVSVLLWVIWLLQYCVVLIAFMTGSMRRMYRVKVKRQWFQPDTHPAVMVDTRVSAMADRFPIPWQWHLPPLAGGLLLWAVPRTREVLSASSVGWVFGGTCVVLPLVFLCLHLSLAGRKNQVYSQDSTVNEQVNRLEKRGWTAALTAADYASFGAGLYLCLRLVCGGRLYSWDYVVYSAVDLLGAAAVVTAILLIQQRRRRLLSRDTQPLVTDDDEYWKNGWYSNPSDRRLFVQDRICSTNYTLNMSHPAARWWVAAGCGICAAAVGVCLVITVMLGDLAHTSVRMTVSGSTVTVEASFYHCTFSAEEIESAELVDDLPDEEFRRTNGASTDQVALGYYEGEETGDAMMFVIRGEKPLLRIDLPGRTIFLNSAEEGQTERWYEMLCRLQEGEGASPS